MMSHENTGKKIKLMLTELDVQILLKALSNEQGTRMRLGLSNVRAIDIMIDRIYRAMGYRVDGNKKEES